MPHIAVLNDAIISVEDIYKFDISTTSPFLCYICDSPLQFRQTRHGDSNYTEHFYHPNTVKGTHTECELATLDRLRDTDTWHSRLSGFLERESREVIRKRESVKHIVDAYDSHNDMGIEFQNSPISAEAIQSRDATTYLDWIFNVETQYIRKVQIGRRVICEIPHGNWEVAVKTVKNSVYLYTGRREWIFLEDRERYHIEVDGVRRNVWIGKPCTVEKLFEDTCLENVLTQEGLNFFTGLTAELERTRIMYARCKRSMFLLDDIHRRYVYKHQFQANEILAIKSVAGSGKTTTLLELAKRHSDKKILYLAFNKSLINDIGVKIKAQSIENLFPRTFHSLAHDAYRISMKRDPNITNNFGPHTIDSAIPWLKRKAYGIRKYYAQLYTKFSRSVMLSPEEFSDKPLLKELWQQTLQGNLLTHDSILKVAMIKHLLKGYVDERYDMIMIDETQDFDMLMLNMVLHDTTVPKIFVGDPMQSIYQWRGCINGFQHLPPNALIVEFYSTFRIGDPACEVIRQKFKDCWIISKCKRETILTDDASLLKGGYTYLFRSWKKLLMTAQRMKDIWVYNFKEKAETIRKMHPGLRKMRGELDDESEDDLPKFLRTLSEEQLEELLSAVEENSTTEQEAEYKFYTIHSYKGLEDAHVRIADDIDDKLGEDKNLYYVALTRGMTTIVEDRAAVDLLAYFRPGFI